MSRLFIIVLMIAACTFLLIREGFSQDDVNIWTVETEGTGLITNDDLASARNNAINDALRSAVERAVASLMPLRTLDNKGSQAIRDRIYAKSDQYIHDYKISSERQIQKVYAVNVRSAVFIGSIRNDLHTLGLLKIEKDRIPSTEIAVTVKDRRGNFGDRGGQGTAEDKGEGRKKCLSASDHLGYGEAEPGFSGTGSVVVG